jgi:acetyl esterase/lipase
MKESNSGSPQIDDTTSIGWTAITLTILLLCVSPGTARESGRPARADRTAPGPSTSAGQPQGANVRVLEQISYGTEAPQAQMLIAYLVQQDKLTAAIIQILSGGWNSSPPQKANPEPFKPYLDAGISVVVVAHRPLGKDIHWPVPGNDIARAIQFVRFRARDWNIDPNRIAAIGGSAGAHLAAWVGLHDDLAKPDSPDPIERLSSRLTCFVALSGPMDLLRVDPRTLAKAGVRGESFAEAFVAAVGSTPEQFMTEPDIRRRLKEASPVFLVSPDDPAALVVGAGPAETALVPPTVPATINDPHSAWQMALLADTIRRAGVQVVARLGLDVGKDPQADAAAIAEFLKKHLKKDTR